MLGKQISVRLSTTETGHQLAEEGQEPLILTNTALLYQGTILFLRIFQIINLFLFRNIILNFTLLCGSPLIVCECIICPYRPRSRSLAVSRLLNNKTPRLSGSDGTEKVETPPSPGDRYIHIYNIVFYPILYIRPVVFCHTRSVRYSVIFHSCYLRSTACVHFPSI